MTKIDTLNYCNHKTIMINMLTVEEINIMKDFIFNFYSQNHGVEYGVLNAVLISAIMFTKERNKLPNEVYLRRTLETFRDENKITNTAEAVAYMEKTYKLLNSWNKRHRVNRPAWLDEYDRELENLEAINSLGYKTDKPAKVYIDPNTLYRELEDYEKQLLQIKKSKPKVKSNRLSQELHNLAESKRI